MMLSNCHLFFRRQHVNTSRCCFSCEHTFKAVLAILLWMHATSIREWKWSKNYKTD